MCSAAAQIYCHDAGIRSEHDMTVVIEPVARPSSYLLPGISGARYRKTSARLSPCRSDTNITSSLIYGYIVPSVRQIRDLAKP